MILSAWVIHSMKSYGPVIEWLVSMAAITLVSNVVEGFYVDWLGLALRTPSSVLMTLTNSIAIFGYANLIIREVAYCRGSRLGKRGDL
jgi:hypothetical protein